MAVNFDLLNRQTRDFNNRNVNRFNESTKSNYCYFDPCKANNETYYTNNNQYSNHYNFWNK